MAIRTALWKVTATPQALVEAQLTSEKLLEDMIVAAPRVLSDEWMLIGRQEHTGVGGIIDLLAVAPDGSLVLIELKRDRAPRDVVVETLDYAGLFNSLGHLTLKHLRAFAYLSAHDLFLLCSQRSNEGGAREYH